MRILYHHRTKSRDGQYVHIAEMQEAFRRRGHEVREVAPAAGETVAFGAESASLARLSRRVPSSLREVLEWGYNAVSLFALERVLKDWRPDLFYERYAMGNVAGLLAARRHHLPLFLEVNAPLAWERHRFGGLTFPGLARRLESMTLRRADRVLAVTEVLRGILIEEGASPDRVDVIPNGVNPARFARTPSRSEAKRRLGLEGRTVLGFVGFCREWHRLDRVVRLLAHGEAASSDVHFLLVGDGPAREPILAEARRLGLSERVTITGIVERDAVVDHVAAFDVALQPEVIDYASPLKLFEYLVMGKAVVAPDRPNIREVVRSGEHAVLFDPESDGSFGETVDRLLRDEGLREHLGQNARRLILERPYTWDHNAERVERLARDAVDSARQEAGR